MNSYFIMFTILYISCIKTSLADWDNLQDFCPTATTGKPTAFINGLLCKNLTNVSASDFKSSILNHAGDVENFFRSSLTLATAAEFPGLNTLGLSMSRTDLDVDGQVFPHSHPRASEIFFVSNGTIIAGFIDTKNQLFQKTVKEGDVFVIPRGMLHFCLNSGYKAAVVFSFLNSQNPGVVKISDVMFIKDRDTVIDRFMTKIKSAAALQDRGIEKVTTIEL